MGQVGGEGDGAKSGARSQDFNLRTLKPSHINTQNPRFPKFGVSGGWLKFLTFSVDRKFLLIAAIFD